MWGAGGMAEPRQQKSELRRRRQEGHVPKDGVCLPLSVQAAAPPAQVGGFVTPDVSP